MAMLSLSLQRGTRERIHPQWFTLSRIRASVALGHDEGLSRIWGGIHFRFEIDTSEVSCYQVADYIYDNYMQPRRH